MVSMDDSITLAMPADLRATTWADAAFSVEFLEGGPPWTIYPNPSQDVFTVLLKHDSVSQCKYALYSMLGAKILEQKIPLNPANPSFMIDLQAHSAGTSLLVADFAGKTFIRKLVKQ